jgi:hypothetical protein
MLFQVYGSTEERANALRLFEYGKLRMEDTANGPMLPRNTGALPNDNDARVVPDRDLFLAGGACGRRLPNWGRWCLRPVAGRALGRKSLSLCIQP